MNAKQEFLNHVGDPASVKCVNISIGDPYFEDESVEHNLRVDHTPEDMFRFIEGLNFEYHNGYGSQNLFGCIWYHDGTWSTRGEYDGSEWWERHCLPDIPDYLIESEAEYVTRIAQEEEEALIRSKKGL